MTNEIKPRIVDGEPTGYVVRPSACSYHMVVELNGVEVFRYPAVNQDMTLFLEWVMEVCRQRDQALAKLERLQNLDRYNAYSASGYEGSGDSWVDIDKESDGEWVKHCDLMAILQGKGER